MSRPPARVDHGLRPGLGTASPGLVMFVAFGGTALVNYAFSLVMGRLLLPGDFGLLAFAQTVLLIGAVIVGSGITWSLAATIAACPGDRRGALIRGALIANLGLGVLVGALIVLLFALGPLRPGLESWEITILVALTLLFISVINVTAAALQGAERFAAVAMIQSVEIACKAVGGVLLTLLGFGVDGAIAGFAAGAVAGSLFGLYVVSRGLGVRLRGATRLPTMHTAGPLFVALLGLALLQNLDLAAVKLLTGSDRTLAGYYQAATILATAPYFLVSSALIPVLVPRLARQESVLDTRPIIADALRLIAVLIVPMEVVLALVPRPVLDVLFSGNYTDAAPTLRILAIGNSALMAAAVLSAAYLATGRAKLPAAILVGTTAVEAIILGIGVPRWHLVGAATIFSLAASGALGALCFTYLRAVGRNQVRSLGRWLIKWAAATAVGSATGVLLIVTGATAVIVVGFGCAGYVAIALRLGMITSPGWIGARRMRHEIIADASAGDASGNSRVSSSGKNPRVSIVIPSWSGEVARLMRSIEQQTFRDYDVTVVRGISPAARARNIGAARTSGAAMLFIDDDAYFGHERVLDIMVELTEKDPRTAVVGTSKLLPPEASAFQRAVARQVPRMVHPAVSETQVSNPPADSYGFTAISTTCCTVRRSAFEQVGGFDESMITGPEDVDFFDRIHRLGYDILLAAHSEVYHDPPAALHGLLRKSFRYGVGRAQLARKSPHQAIPALKLDRWSGKAGLALAILAFPPAFFVHLYLDPVRRLAFGFRPLKTLSTYAVLCGYVCGWYRGVPRKPETAQRRVPRAQ